MVVCHQTSALILFSIVDQCPSPPPDDDRQLLTPLGERKWSESDSDAVGDGSMKTSSGDVKMKEELSTPGDKSAVYSTIADWKLTDVEASA